MEKLYTHYLLNNARQKIVILASLQFFWYFNFPNRPDLCLTEFKIGLHCVPFFIHLAVGRPISVLFQHVIGEGIFAVAMGAIPYSGGLATIKRFGRSFSLKGQ